MDTFPKQYPRHSSYRNQIEHPLDVTILRMQMRVRLERDKLWLSQYKQPHLGRDVWNIVVSYYADDLRVIDLIDNGTRLNLSNAHVFKVTDTSDSGAMFDLSGHIESEVNPYLARYDTVNGFRLFQILLILPIIFDDGSEGKNDDSEVAWLQSCDSNNVCNSEKYIIMYTPEIRDKLYKRLAQLDAAA